MLQEEFRTAEVARVGSVLVQRDLGELSQHPYVAGQHGEQLVGAFLVNHRSTLHDGLDPESLAGS
ncbi:MAG: hypothetical protein M3R63_04425, partial [Actinomycetota bacterium]|nr:hypothetical protein [Actinomycetota bacterium]